MNPGASSYKLNSVMRVCNSIRSILVDSVFLENYRFLARYNRWMNQCLYAACETLTDAERKTDKGGFSNRFTTR